MRLLYWAEQFHPYLGGIEVLTAGALPRLQALGFSCSVITSTGPLDLPDEGWYGSIPVYRFPFRKTLESRDPAAVNLLARRLGQLESTLAPALVHVFLSDPSCLFHLAARRSQPSRLVVSVHNWRSTAPDAGPSLLGRVLTEADWVVGNSAFTLDQLHLVAPSCADRSSVIHSGVESPAFAPTEFSLNPLRMVCVGRLVETKGFDLVLSALARLLPDHPDARLRLIGDGPARPALEAVAAKLGIGEAVEFPGWVDPDQVYEHLDRASVVLIPSRSPETLCQVAIQASLMARPIVATRIGGLPEVVVHEQTGLLVEPNDSAGIADAVDRLCRSPLRARAMARSARTRALSTFTMSSYVDGVAALYRRLGGD
jgi:glycogen synthase